MSWKCVGSVRKTQPQSGKQIILQWVTSNTVETMRNEIRSMITQYILLETAKLITDIRYYKLYCHNMTVVLGEDLKSTWIPASFKGKAVYLLETSPIPRIPTLNTRVLHTALTSIVRDNVITEIWPLERTQQTTISSEVANKSSFRNVCL
jgi:hypothetical protein